ASMTWFVGEKVGRLTGSAWAQRLEPWGALRHVIADAGVPLQAGIAREQERRGRTGREPLASTLDAFHTKHEARQALALDWNRVERDWEAFEQAEARLRKDRRQGIDARAAAGKARRAWAVAGESFDRYEAIEAAWKHAEAAL